MILKNYSVRRNFNAKKFEIGQKVFEILFYEDAIVCTMQFSNELEKTL